MPRKKTIKETHELTSIETEEVSLVDKAANLRTFLIVKAADGTESMEEVESLPTSEEAEALLMGKGEEPAADPMDVLAAPVVEVPEVKADELLVAVEADAVLSAEGTVEAVGEELAEAGVQVGDVLELGEEVPTVEARAVVDAALEESREAPTVEDMEARTPPVTKADEDAEAPALKMNPAAKRAMLGVVGALATRLEDITAMINGAEEDPSAIYMPHAVEGALYYFMSLSASALDMAETAGNAEWEIEAAAVSGLAKSFKDAKEDRIAKVGRAISGARLAKMRDVARALQECQEKFSGIIAEVDAESPTEEVGKSAVTIDVELTNKLEALTKAQESDAKKIATLQATLEKQALLLDSPRPSNSLPVEEVVKKSSAAVVWPSDMASRRR